MQILFFLVAFLTAGIEATIGFGIASILLPVAVMFYDFQTALILVSFVDVFGNAARVLIIREKFNKHLIITFGVASVIGSLIGALLVPFFSQELLKGLLGVVLLMYVVVSFGNKRLITKPRLYNELAGGGISGLLTGLIGTGGAVRSAFLATYNLAKEQYIATAATISIGMNAARIPAYLGQGFLTEGFYWYVPVLSMIGFAGAILGKQITEKIPQKQFRHVILIGIAVIALKFLYDWLMTVALFAR